MGRGKKMKCRSCRQHIQFEAFWRCFFFLIIQMHPNEGKRPRVKNIRSSWVLSLTWDINNKFKHLVWQLLYVVCNFFYAYLISIKINNNQKKKEWIKLFYGHINMTIEIGVHSIGWYHARANSISGHHWLFSMTNNVIDLMPFHYLLHIDAIHFFFLLSLHQNETKNKKKEQQQEKLIAGWCSLHTVYNTWWAHKFIHLINAHYGIINELLDGNTM